MSVESIEGWDNPDRWHLIWETEDMITTWYGDRTDRFISCRKNFASDLVFVSSDDAIKYAVSRTRGTSIRLNWRDDFGNIDKL